MQLLPLKQVAQVIFQTGFCVNLLLKLYIACLFGLKYIIYYWNYASNLEMANISPLTKVDNIYRAYRER